MESGTFIQSSIQKEFGRFVEIRLHTDHSQAEVRERNQDLQRERFGTVALPFYAVLDASGENVLWTGAGVMSEELFLAGLRMAP